MPNPNDAAAKAAGAIAQAGGKATAEAIRNKTLRTTVDVRTRIKIVSRCESTNGRIGQSVLRCFLARGHDGEHVY